MYVQVYAIKQATFKEFGNYQIDSKLMRVLGHRWIDGHDLPDQMERMGSEYPPTGPELACDISVGIAEKVVGDWTET
jgi:hypothetical protein